ncbi:MAG: hypothetical protein U5K79_05330 [Cyclobacteriaceae bacterium]|nr:hypothetical protein [Cyclobacteriaceae bacterium]
MTDHSRHLAAIMFTDISGYTALMGRDEEKAMELLHVNRLIHKSLIEKYNGRWMKEMETAQWRNSTAPTMLQNVLLRFRSEQKMN